MSYKRYPMIEKLGLTVCKSEGFRFDFIDAAALEHLLQRAKRVSTSSDDYSSAQTAWSYEENEKATYEALLFVIKKLEKSAETNKEKST
jgi:hypothetical protein